jgi:hypothetical protein
VVDSLVLMTLSVDDRFELQELYARYCYGVDTNDSALILSLFAPGGGFHRANASASFGQAQSWQGDDALHEYFTSRGAGRPANQHWINSLWFDQSGEVLVGHAALAILQQADDRGEIFTLANYTDELVRVDGAWRFQNRVISFLF